MRLGGGKTTTTKRGKSNSEIGNRNSEIGKVRVVVAVLFLLAAACSGESVEGPDFRDLRPYENPFGEEDSRWEEQPERFKPQGSVLCERRGHLFVALPGSVDRPRSAVAVVDVERRRVVDRLPVGRAPSALALHPGGDHLVVANRFSNYLTVVDLRTGSSARHETDFYTEGLLFDVRGEHLYLANRWKNAVQVLQVRRQGGELDFRAPDDPSVASEIPVGFNPQRMALSGDERFLYVASTQALTVSAVDTSRFGVVRQPITTATPVDVDEEATSEPPTFADEEVAPGVERLWIGAPPFDLVATPKRLFVATLSESTHHPAETGDDAHDYMPPSQGSPNQGFQALQNEIATFAKSDLQPRERYTSTDYCCPDVRDVSPDDPARGHLVPDASLRIVDGALPVALTTYESPAGTLLLVAYGGSNEVQRFEVTGDGELEAGPTISVGFDPRSLQVDEERGEAFVINRLGESVSVIDLSTFEVVDEIALSTDSPGFPATDAELGELIFFSGADFSVDGGQTCNHCHFDRGNIGKFFQMPFLADPRGLRMTMDVRGLYDTTPWLMEGVADENDLFVEFLEMAHADNFCCEDAEDREVCASERPAPCDEEPFSTRPALRDAFFLEAADELVERRRSFGGAMEELALDFEGVNRLVGLFLIHEPGLLPNPNPLDTPGAERGRLLFESPTTGCNVCHPAPTFGVSREVNPFRTPLVFGPVIDPVLEERTKKNLDLLSEDFLERFPDAVQTGADVHLKSTSLRGMWDRAPGFYHDGRARTLRRAVVPPGHPALEEGEEGYNVADGVIDSHGGTSHLTKGEVEDLLEFLKGL